MADLTDVSAALVTLIAATLYPNGTGQASAVGVDVRVFPGWPSPGQLDGDLRAATPICQVSVYPRPEERNTTRYAADWKTTSTNTATLTLTLVGQVATLAGAIPPANNPHVIALIANGNPYVYAVLVGDTITTAAAALAALVAVDIPGTAAAFGIVTLPNAARLTSARVVVTGTAAREVRRQERTWQIAVWADTPTHRDAIARVIDPVLAATTFLSLPDGTAGRLIYKGSPISDALQKDRLYRRDFMYSVEYGTTQVETETQIAAIQVNESVAVAGVLPYVPTSITYF